MPRDHRLLTITLLIACTSLPVGVASAGTWTGKEVTQEGVLHVVNPARPVDGATTLSPPQAWNAGGDEDDDILFGVLRDIAIDRAGHVYLLDAQLNQVHVFDRDGTFVRAIGREGEGPGEFRRPSSMFITPDGKIAVVQSMPGKIVLLTPDGKPAGDFNTPGGSEQGMRMYSAAATAGNNVLLGINEFSQHDGAFNFKNQFILVDAVGKLRATIYEKTGKRDMANMGFDEKESFRPQWGAGADGRVYIVEAFDAYRINVYSPAGTLERVIEREYTPRKRTKEEMEENKPRVMIRSDRGAQRPDVKASPTDSDVVRMFAREDGTLWVLSSHGAYDNPAGTFVTFDVFDARGRFTQQVAVKADGDFRKDGLQLVGDQFFVLNELRAAQRAMFGSEDESPDADEEEAEPMSVLCYRLTPPTAAKK